MNEDIFSTLPEVIARRYTKISTKYILMIARKLKSIGEMSATDVHTLSRLALYGYDVQEIEKDLSDTSGLSIRDIYEAMEIVAERSITAANALAEIKGMSKVKLSDNPHLQMTVKALSDITAGTFQNISNTTAIGISVTNPATGSKVFKPMEQAYKDAVDYAISEVSMGITDYQSSIRKVLREFSDSGLQVLEYESGYHRRLDSAVRQNILDGAKSVYQGIQIELGKQFGADGVEISAHAMCAEDHLPYQGRQYTNEEFEKLQNSLYRQFGQWNCRHSWWSIIIGISQPAYSDQELRSFIQNSTETIEFEGKTMSRYEATQQMRRIETAVRKSKDRANVAKEIGDDSWRRHEQNTINQLTSKYNQLAYTAGLERQPTRMSVSGFRAVKGIKEDSERKSRQPKKYAVDWDFVLSPQYKEKFNGITYIPEVDELIHQKAIQMLKHREGTPFEDLFVIDVIKKEVVASNADSRIPFAVPHTKSIREVIDNSTDDTLITMHNHPNSHSPSGTDIKNTCPKSIKCGVVVCNNGEVFTYKTNSVNIFSEESMDSGIERLINIYTMSGSNDYRSFELAMNEINRFYNIIKWERR